MLHEFTLRTGNFKPIVLRVPSIVDTSIFSANSAASAGGHWEFRAYRNIVDLEKIWGGRAPNAIKITPWHESALAGASCTFNIGVFGGKNATMTRVCKVSGTLGLYRTIRRVDGVAVNTSGRYVDAMTITDFWNEVASHDAGGADGKAGVSFDLRGNKFVTLEIEFIGTNGGKIGFEAEGY